MSRLIEKGVDVLVVEGPDDGVVVNAFIEKHLGVHLGPPSPKLIKVNEEGGGWEWALSEFDRLITEAHERARIGVIIDRDGVENRDDNWPRVRECLKRCGMDVEEAQAAGHVVNGRFGVWMWPDNVTKGDLEHFVGGIVQRSAVLDYAEEACQTAKANHGAEYDAAHSRKAALKVRSIWRDASAAGGYGHLVRNLRLVETPASQLFLKWFQTLFLSR